ncbi:threonine synthase [Leucobacter musarum]|uniref:threonine synthase n=1 Tax=Leucobacter musarum TaxID=1930747 RepID=UPI0006A7A0D9|nr:threonine synthase [Leucobacter musarum]
MSTDAAYVDPISAARVAIEPGRWRSNAGDPLLLTPGAGITAADIDAGSPGLWRYRAAFAVDVPDPISLGEGRTPLVPTEWLGARPLCKLEWASPTGSFKDRGASVMLSVLRQQGATSVIEDSSGNGGASIAAYGAAGGLDVTVFAPASTSPAKLVQARAYGARIELVAGPREASQSAAIAAAEHGDGWYASHNWQPFFLEGTKTLAYEMWEDLGFRAPDAVVMPVGAGSSLLGCAFGFRELLHAGAIDRLPRLYAAQPQHCSPVDAAFHVKPAPGAAAARAAAFQAATARPVMPTIAEGTAIARPLRLMPMLEALRESGGGTVAVPEAGIRAAHAGLAARGLYAEPTSATAAAALEVLLDRGAIHPDETTVVLLTGSGLKAAG